MAELDTTTITKEISSDPKNPIVVEIGDSKQLDFKPQFKLIRWDNEVNFSIRAEEQPGAVVEELDGVIMYKTPTYEVHQYEKPEGFEFEWVLLDKPDTNVLTTTIQSKGLNFFYQGELTDEEIAEGCIRPENVVGSYAVYHATKGGLNDSAGMAYQSGKFCHIYRPKAIDAKGVEIWCDLNIDETNGLLTVTVPEKFLDTATYPVKVDPTIGYTTHGGTQVVLFSSSPIFCSIVSTVTASSGDTITDFNVWGNRGSGPDVNFQFAAFSVVAGVVTNQLANGVPILITSVTDQLWTSGAVSQSMVAGTTYGIAISFESIGANTAVIDYDNGSAPGRFNSTRTTFPGAGNDFSPTGTDSGRHYSIYATYTAGGGGGSAPVSPSLFQLLGVGV